MSMTLLSRRSSADFSTGSSRDPSRGGMIPRDHQSDKRASRRGLHQRHFWILSKTYRTLCAATAILVCSALRSPKTLANE